MEKETLKKCVIIGIATAVGYGLFGKLGLAAIVLYFLMK